MAYSTRLAVQTQGRGTLNVTGAVEDAVRSSDIATGVCQVFVLHTSASLTITENADPDVQRDLDAFMNRLVPDGDPLYVHTAEGPDDMPAHVRSVLTQTSLTVPVANGSLVLGTWQGIFLWEHRSRPHRRQLQVTVLG